MGNHVHFAFVCEPPLLEELGRCAAQAIALRDRAPFDGFFQKHLHRFTAAERAAKRPTFADSIRACAVSEADVGLGDLDELLSAEVDLPCIGRLLFSIPRLSEDEEPSDAVIERCLKELGHYSTGDANDLLRNDAWEICGYYYAPPSWADGAGLIEAQGELKRARAKLARARKKGLETLDMEAKLAQYETTMASAAREGLAVVEWTHKL